MTVPRGMRLCNPGNIRISAAPWVGKKTPSDDPAFETFTELKYGIRAAAKIFLQYHSVHKLTAIAQYIGRWAPASDSNPTDAYVKFIAGQCNIDPYDEYDLCDAGLLASFLDAVFRFEQGGNYCPAPAITAGVEAALGESVA